MTSSIPRQNQSCPSEQELCQRVYNMTDLAGSRIAPWSICHRKRARRAQGVVTFLCHDERADIMSNEPFETEEAAEFAVQCSGHVLVLGLGIGLIVRMLLACPQVDQIYVVESEQEVLKLVAPYFNNQRVKFYQANAYDSDAPENLFGDRKFDAVWMDVWDTAKAETYNMRLLVNQIWGDRADLTGIWAMGRSETAYNAQK